VPGTRRPGPGPAEPGEGRRGSGPAPAVAGEEEGPPRGRLGIDPRFRQRLIDVKREAGRRRLRWLIVGTAGLTAVALAVGIVWSPAFAVRHVVVLGGEHTRPALVLAAAGLDHHPLMVDVDAARADRAIDRLPWVAQAHVQRHWPDGITVVLSERVPVAMVGPVGDTKLVDVAGRVLAGATFGTALPEVEIESTPGVPGPVAGPAPGPAGSEVAAGYLPGLAVAAAMPPALVPRTLAIVVGSDGTLTLRLSSGASAVLGDSTQMEQKLIAVLTLVERVRIGTETIDATVPALPVLRSRP
jgi:cell division protein FtsQ